MSDAVAGVASPGGAATVGQVAPVGPIAGRGRMTGERGAPDSPATSEAIAALVGIDAFEPSARLLAAITMAVRLADRLQAPDAEASGSDPLPPAIPLATTPNGMPGAALTQPLLATRVPGDVERAAETLRVAVQVASRAIGVAPQPSASGDRAGAEPNDSATSRPSTASPHAVAILGQAWTGQPLDMAIEPDPRRKGPYRDEPEAPVVWGATMRLELPHLGVIDIAVRTVGRSVAVELRNPLRQLLGDAIPELAARLAMQGLDPISLAALAPSDRDPTA